MPPRPKPRRRRQGAYAEPGSVRPELSASAYYWPCPQCDCTRNLRGLARDECSWCQHVHQPPEKEPPCPR